MVLLRLRAAGRGHPADALEAGAEPDELAGWVERLASCPVGDLDEELLAKAFTACHSSAEVYRLEAIEKVFGSVGRAQAARRSPSWSRQMRANLAGVWRQPAEQEKKKTKRKQKDIQAEVLRGYEVARGVIEDGLEKFPDHWALLAGPGGAPARREQLPPGAEQVVRLLRSAAQAFAEFRRAAELYAKAVRGARRRTSRPRRSTSSGSPPAWARATSADHRGEAARPGRSRR